ncbi:MAG: S-methyl-5-thioribose-1-phosphate isomerase, partial [Thiohalorhabdaceae bacterium]
MLVDGVPYRAIWLDDDGWSVCIIDQTRLPWEWQVVRLTQL